MFSRTCHYALQAMIYIASKSKDSSNVGLNEIAAELSIPKHFLSKVLQTLVKHKLLVSMKGPTGGFSLAKSPSEINMVDIIEYIDGLDIFNQCGIGFKACDDENPCPIHNEYKEVRFRIRLLFENKSLEELVLDVEKGNSIISLP